VCIRSLSYLCLILSPTQSGRSHHHRAAGAPCVSPQLQAIDSYRVFSAASKAARSPRGRFRYTDPISRDPINQSATAPRSTSIVNTIPLSLRLARHRRWASGVVAFKEKFQGCWLWSLPQRAPQDAVDGRSPAKSQRSKVKKRILRGGRRSTNNKTSPAAASSMQASQLPRPLRFGWPDLP
jgi:hypothetical protein